MIPNPGPRWDITISGDTTANHWEMPFQWKDGGGMGYRILEVPLPIPLSNITKLHSLLFYTFCHYIGRRTMCPSQPLGGDWDRLLMHVYITCSFNSLCSSTCLLGTGSDIFCCSCTSMATVFLTPRSSYHFPNTLVTTCPVPPILMGLCWDRPTGTMDVECHYGGALQITLPIRDQERPPPSL